MWKRKLCWTLFVLLIVAMVGLGLAQTRAREPISRDDFPSHFVFGSGTSAYQVEGAASEDGRSPSFWDTFAHSGGAMDKSTGDMACDEYHKYKEDVKLMVDTGLEAYRFSISWSRLIPNGRGPVNPKGLQYYNNLINELTSHGIQPHVTLFHYDLPQTLEDEYKGWLSLKIVKDFTAFANVCFREFGDRVSHWTTLNEPNVGNIGGYDLGIFPPAHCSSPFGFKNCKSGNSSVEPYIVTHNILLAHASVARLYKKKYQAKQQGFVGINIFAYYLVPSTNTTEDIRATQRANDFYIGWLLDPLVFGDYPETVKKNAGSRIPSFTPRQSRQLKGSSDFFALNYYFTMYVKDDPSSLNHDQRDYMRDIAIKLINKARGLPIPGELPVIPFGMQGVLEYIKQAYDNPPIYIHENGLETKHNDSLNDMSRVKYLEGNIESLLLAVRNGSNVKGYFTWSFLDVYELFYGYQSSYGLYYVDFNSPDLERYPKLSAHWYSNFLKGRRRRSNI
ncbi:beta-glucosidase 22-like isoform X1 [Telopea speciosissima]|uniref:beta-glucosidase 22-like isoform X1 n=1 Tax=Telopea speciosissima TaxID=54955 RepID=UPI001CC615D8|nr:beta-glucosidase 22-like isoform X1 [Telopea speciosissima]